MIIWGFQILRNQWLTFCFSLWMLAGGTQTICHGEAASGEAHVEKTQACRTAAHRTELPASHHQPASPMNGPSWKRILQPCLNVHPCGGEALPLWDWLKLLILGLNNWIWLFWDLSSGAVCYATSDNQNRFCYPQVGCGWQTTCSLGFGFGTWQLVEVRKASRRVGGWWGCLTELGKMLSRAKGKESLVT